MSLRTPGHRPSGFGYSFATKPPLWRLVTLEAMQTVSPQNVVGGSADWLASLDRDGFVVLSGALRRRDLAALVGAIAEIDDGPGVRSRAGRYAVRDLLSRSGEIRRRVSSPPLISLARDVLGPSIQPVRGTLFDKVEGANWLVPWHQDLTICVRERAEVAGYGPWTVKAGVPHVQPPAALLESMLSIRIHLDDCGEHNGPLRVLPGTHRLGRLSPSRIEDCRREIPEVVCAAEAGDLLLMRPLLLHASSAAARASHRRVIHIDYSAGSLPAGLTWFQ